MVSTPIKICMVLIIVFLFFLDTAPAHRSNDDIESNQLIIFDRVNTVEVRSKDVLPWWMLTSMDMNRNFIHDSIEIEHVDGKQIFPVYVDLVHPPDNDIIEKIRSIGGEISYICKYIDTICMRNVTYPMIERLLAMDEVVFVEEQPFLTIDLDVSARNVGARPSADYSPKTVWELGYTGKEVVVAVLDTGVDDNHADLRNKFVAGYDCSGNYGVAWTTNPDDKNGHGTHCAGVIMGTGDLNSDMAEREYVGVAPDARLVDVKVLTDIGVNLGDHLIMGMEWCIENMEQFGIDILSISVGTGGGGDDGTNANARTANGAVDAGLIVVTAAGNEGPNNDGFSSVAASDKVITVGAVEDGETVTRDDDVIADYSNRGPRKTDNDDDVLEELKPDVVAPGTDIMSCMYSPRPVGFVTGYQQMTGTSMACPHVAGIAALMLEAKPGLNASKVKHLLRKTAEPKGSVYDSDISESYSREYGFGRVNAYEALRGTLEDYQTIMITSASNDDIIGAVYEISGVANNEEQGALQYVEIKIDEGEWHRALGTYQWSYTLDTEEFENGEHFIYARCFNGRNHSDEDRVKIIFNNVRLHITTPDENAAVFGHEIIITGRTEGINIEFIEVSIDNRGGFKAEDTSLDGDFTIWHFMWITEGFPEKEYTFQFTAGGSDVFTHGTSVKLRFKLSSPKDEGSSIPLPWVGWSVLSGILIIAFTKNRKNKK